MSLLRSLVKGRLEPLVAKIFSRFFWPPVVVSVLVTNDLGEILALELDDRYELPGGLVKGGEDLKEAARRELKEETGLEAEIGDLLDIRTEDSTGHLQVFFEAEVEDGELSGSWEGEPEFIPEDEIHEKVWRLRHSHIYEYLFPE